MNISSSQAQPAPRGLALFNLGFRIFFLSAGLFAFASMSLWVGVYLLHLPITVESITLFQWHAHEMVYGYAMAAIAGFLLTAARNWTGVQTLHGWPLALLFSCWAAARLLLLGGTDHLPLAAIFDLLFDLGLIAAVAYPIVKVRQWRQLAILSKLAFLALFNGLFYLGAFGQLDTGAQWSVYGGLYLVISLVLTLGRRVVPFFIERGVGYPVQLYNARWLDISSLVCFLLFTIVEVFFELALLSALLALALFAINVRRLVGWHTRGIWRTPLLWVLYIGLWFICLGFLLTAIANLTGGSQFPAVHAFAVGGIGVMTLGMMARVSLGHSGRSIATPPPSMPYAFALLVAAGLIRVLLPILLPGAYLWWIGLSQLLWIVAFGLFSITYLPILGKPRIDGRPG